MEFRNIDIIAPRGTRKEIDGIIASFQIQQVWKTTLDSKSKSIRFVVETEHADKILDSLDKRFSSKENFRVIISSVLATIPRAHAEESPIEKVKKPTILGNPKLVSIYREELYSYVLSQSQLSPNKMVLFALSAIIAAIGFIYNNTPIIIGSMMVAPFLGPNLGLAFGATIGDSDLMKKGLRTLSVGFVLVMIMGIIRGRTFFDGIESVESLFLSYDLIFLSFISGAAAIISLLEKNNTSLVGVAVAVSLLPPLTLSGMLLGQGDIVNALHAFFVFIANIICINLAGIATFHIAGIHPAKRREAKKAKIQTQKATIFWTIMLLLLLIITFFLTQ